VTPTRIAEEQVSDGSDVPRSDDPESGSLHNRAQEAGQVRYDLGLAQCPAHSAGQGVGRFRGPEYA
jgi:hypothetical protein